MKPTTENPFFSIRPETPEDYNVIYDLIYTAFKTAKVKDGDEQDFADKLRNSHKYIPQLALVAEFQGKLIGHIMFTHFVVRKPDNTLFDALLLAPISVLLEYRNMGIGSALIKEGFAKAIEMGYEAVFLIGDPNYYSRFGFVSTSNYDIHNVNEIPNEYAMVKELIPGSLSEVSGVVNYL